MSSAPSINRDAIHRKRWFLFLSILVVLVSTLLQLSSIKGGAVIDDRRLIHDYEGRGCGANPMDCFQNMMFGFYYRPFPIAIIAIGQRLHDDRPMWFHIENLVLHAAAVFVALWMFRLLFKRRKAALIAGLFYAFQPIQVCYTSFIGGRDESLVALCILLFAIGVRNAGRRIALLRRVNGPAAMTKIVAWIGFSLIGLLGAEFSKEQVVPLVLLAPLLAMPLRVRSRSDRSSRKTKLQKARTCPVTQLSRPYWTLIYIVPVALFLFAAHSALHDIDYVNAPWSTAMRIEMVGRTLWSYTTIYLFPTVGTMHLTTLGAWEPPQILVTLLGYTSLGIWIALMACNWSNRPRRILMLWASLGIFLCLNVIPVPTQFASPYRAGIPLFGIAGLVGSFVAPDDFRTRSFAPWYRIVTGPMVTAALVAGMTVWFAIVSFEDVPNWHDEYVLMKAEVAADPNFVCARAALASYDLQYGQLGDAKKQFDRCLVQLFGPNSTPDRYVEMIRSPAMVRTLQSASTLRYYRPVQYIPQIIRERGRTLLALNRPADALPDLRAALQINSADTLARTDLETCYRQLHDDRQADAVHRMDDVLLGRKL